eukprot:EG_transcript_17485
MAAPPDPNAGLYGGADPLARPDSLPLAGRRVLITAPRSYAAALAARLVAAGARPLHIPGVVTCRLLAGSSEAQQLDNALHRLLQGRYTHVAFTSRAGIEAILERLAALGPDLSPEPRPATTAADRPAVLAAGAARLAGTNVRVWALGADAQALRVAGVPEVQTPAVPSTDGLVSALAQTTLPPNAAVLCPVPHVAPPLVEPPVVPQFLAALADLGANPDRVPAYETAPGTAVGAAAPELELLGSGAVAAAIFTSAAEAQGLARAAGGVPELVAALRRGNVVLAAHGPTTARGVESVLGLDPGAISVVPKDSASFAGVVEALQEAFTAAQCPHNSTSQL